MTRMSHERTTIRLSERRHHRARHASVNGFGRHGPRDAGRAERPEVLLGAAFVGGFLLARIVRRLAS